MSRPTIGEKKLSGREISQRYWNGVKADPVRHADYLKRRRAYDCRPNRKRSKAEIQRRTLKHRFGLTPQQKDALLLAQGGRCAVCRTNDPRGYGWCIDHDHRCCPGKKTCGKCIRGILCHDCNVMLGFAGDSPTRLIQAVEYLESRGKVNA